MVMRGSRYIARPAGSGPNFIDCVMHGSEHCWMLTHAEVIVRAPDSYRACSSWRVMHCSGKLPAMAQDVCKYAISSLSRQHIQCVEEDAIIIHESILAYGVPVQIRLGQN